LTTVFYFGIILIEALKKWWNICFTKEVAMKGLKVWKEIQTGGYRSKGHLLHCLRCSNFKISNGACDVIDQKSFNLLKEKEIIKLAFFPIADLGFHKGSWYEDIFNKAKEYGLYLCPVETALLLRLAYPDQPIGQKIIVAHEPIIDSSENSSILGISRDNHNKWIFRYPRECPSPEELFCFSLPKNFG
jgi:hypothetical protein